MAVPHFCGNRSSPASSVVAMTGDGRSRDTAAVRVFVVEDDALSAIMLNDLLEVWGFDVCGIADQAVEALVQVEKQRPDLVLMDVRLLGEGDGISLAADIRRLGVRSIFLTAYTDRSTLARMRETEPLGILQKPYSADELQEVINAALERLRLP